MQATLLQKLLQKTTCKSFQLVVGTRTVSIYLSYLLSPSVQRLSSSCGVGDVAPYAHRRGSIRHRQHLELSASHLSVHRQLSLGPLQISLGRMLLDILKFLFIYCLVLLAFANGLNQLYFYYETKASEEPNHCKGIRCEKQNNAFSTWVKHIVKFFSRMSRLKRSIL